jgi:hypothetical protein
VSFAFLQKSSTGELLVMGGTGDTATTARIDLYDAKSYGAPPSRRMEKTFAG